MNSYSEAYLKNTWRYALLSPFFLSLSSLFLILIYILFYQIINPTLDKIIDSAFERSQAKYTIDPEKKESKESAANHICVLDYLITQTQDKTLIRDELLNLLIAGTNTPFRRLIF